MRSFKISITVFILVFLFSLSLQAQNKKNTQDTLVITLQNILELGGANNLTIREYQEREELAKAKLVIAKAWWLPEIYAGVQTHQLGGAVMNSNGNFYLDVNQDNMWLGLGLNANWNIAEGLSVSKAAELQSMASRYHTQAERNKVLLAAINAYYDLMISQLKTLAYKNLVAQSDTISKQIQIQVEAGLRYQSEVLLANSNKNHLKVEMLNARKEYNRTSTVLLHLLHLPQQVKLFSVDTSLLPLDYTTDLFSTSATIYKNRPEIKAIALETKAIDLQEKYYRLGMLIPEVHIGTNGSYYGRMFGTVTPINEGADPYPNQLYPTGELNASVMWRIPLGDVIYQSDLQKYKSQIRIKEIKSDEIKAQINEELASATIQLQTGHKQIEIAKEALELTQEALNQSIERQKMGIAKPFEVFQAQQFFLQARIDYLKSVSEYNKAQFALKVAKGEQL